MSSPPATRAIRILRPHSSPLSCLRHLSAYSKLQEAPRSQLKPATSTSRPAAPRSNQTQLPFLSLVAIFCLGSGSFYWIVKSRAGNGESHYVLPEKAPPKEQWPRSTQSDQSLSRR
ncbi:hypothetical protein B0A54_10176 [Friedmanniomyces endolithicus]|uniref:Uncharacterized protein n=1 Tax=Friedmanniomyces endolithicus TaxID=329885 RepID=A0A4U0UUB0_9PEZI|nr:hypothetical protein B0A54_10176 [Friedmanniomyces endolithicus]